MKYINKIIMLLVACLICIAGKAQTESTHWTCETHAFEYEMGVYFDLQKAGTSITGVNYEVAAFSGEECRGLSQILTHGDTSIGYLRIRSNIAKGDSIFFLVYDKTANEECEIFETISFKSDSLVGMPSSPLMLRIRERAVVKSEDKNPSEINAFVIDDSEKEVMIDNITSNPNTNSITIPANIGDYTVTNIASNTFAGMTNVTDIYLPETEEPIKLDKDALKIDDEHIAYIHVPLALLDDYALMPELKQNYEAYKIIATVTPINKYWTLSCGVGLIVPETVSIHTCEVKNGVEAQITEIKDDRLLVDGRRVLKANNGVLVFCKNERGGDNYDLIANPGRQESGMSPNTYDAKDYGSNNQLEPVIESKNYDPDGYYVLKNNEFYPIAADETKVPACKAILKVPSNVSASRLRITCDGGTTAISNTYQKESAEDIWYNLHGQRIENPVKTGFLIKGGKKVIIK